MTHELVSKLKELANEMGRTPTRPEFVMAGVSDYSIRNAGGFNAIVQMAGLETYHGISAKLPPEIPPKVLIMDIELAPLILEGWQLFDQNFGLNQIQRDWSVLSWAAKWLGDSEDKIMYADTSQEANYYDDKGICSQIWQLLEDADVVLTQNGVRFDTKKLNARFAIHGFPPPSSYRQIDTLKIAKKYFSFTSNKLEYMTDKLCVKYKKLTHGKYPGHKLWSECLKGNAEAWAEMKTYNCYDILSLEELYVDHLRRWDRTINWAVFRESFDDICSCGSRDFRANGYVPSNTGKFQRYTCNQCGAEQVDKYNLLSKEKRKSLRK